jgi:hypothetical protein
VNENGMLLKKDDLELLTLSQRSLQFSFCRRARFLNSMLKPFKSNQNNKQGSIHNILWHKQGSTHRQEKLRKSIIDQVTMNANLIWKNSICRVNKTTRWNRKRIQMNSINWEQN